ncbi:type IV toxin-antitoxin system AbiEi family antitoxin domain-containing protein [Candidatus Palauibacter sp.]|uniref:type IV toxin-antitoxin system AbiEi family antitoxin domain-containing protein n=1 Tax=Candidatus Palauibacter sp. TaxID=3101350 RepID=UPI003B594C9F
MKFMELLEVVADEAVFETGFLRSGRGSEPGLEAQLSRWCAAGKLLRLRRGLFALAPPYRKVVPHPFLVANRLSPGSYVSGLSALAFANAIPEYVPEVTSCGPARPHLRETPLGRFSFRYVKPALRTGYRLVGLVDGQSAFVACPEKAFLDLAHLQPGGDAPAWIDELRMDFNQLSPSRLRAMAAATESPKLARAAAHVIRRATDPPSADEPLPVT